MTAMAVAASLPEDVLLEILFRVKGVPAALFRCAAASTRWRQLVAEPAFLRRCWPDQDVSSSLAGFFTQQYQNTRIPRVHTPCFTPTPRSALAPRHDLLLRSFMTTAAPEGVFDNAAALVSRHGFLLVRLDTRATRGYPNPIVLDLAVCNLLTGACHMLPALKFGSVFDECAWNGFAILTGADCRSNDDEPPVRPPSNSSLFKVAIISSRSKDDMKSSLHTFSSDEASWRVRTNCFDGIVQATKYGSSSRAIVRRGTAHWLMWYYGELRLGVLNLNMRTNEISLTKMPFRMNCYYNGYPFLTLALNGALSLLWMQKQGTKIEIWEQLQEQPNQDDDPEWECTRNINLKQPDDERDNEGRELCFLGENFGTLLVTDTIQGIFTADLRTGMMKDVVDWPRKDSIIPRETVPLEVDWPAIFASRLDTRKQKMENDVTYPPGWELMYLRGNERRKTKFHIHLGGN